MFFSLVAAVLKLGCVSTVSIAVFLGGLWIVLKLRLTYARQSAELARTLASKETVGFFHPYCAAGGGGERVLWCAISSVQKNHPGVHCVVYTGDIAVSRSAMLERAESQFGVSLQQDSVHFVFLNGRRWVEASIWPRFTLLGQSLGSVYLGWEAICKFCPDIMIDSMGYAFTFPIFKLLGNCRVGAYVHYPTISTDMLARVRSREVGGCNDAVVARSSILSSVKLIYYRLFAAVYGMVGRFAEVILCNGSWTRAHIEALWKIPERTCTTFPPCDTSALESLPLKRRQTKAGGHTVLSLAQFRPEKDHAKQLQAFASFLAAAPHHSCKGSSSSERVRLVMAGGCRDEGDWKRFRDLAALCAKLGLRLEASPHLADSSATADSVTGADGEDWDVSLRPNLTVAEVHENLGSADVGLHTMREEHFGISVVEFMAAGAVVLSHNSGGPKMDIVKSSPQEKERLGFLATEASDYADALGNIFGMSAEARLSMATRARASVSTRFSQESFEEQFSSRMIAPLRR